MTTAPTRISREELFAQVWKTPMSRLALQYGITGNGLAKACDRLKVPYPPRGWWAKKAAGKKVAYYRLPEPDADTPSTTVVKPIPKRPELTPEAKQMIEKSTVVANDITVPAALYKPHPIIAGGSPSVSVACTRRGKINQGGAAHTLRP